MAVFFFKNSLVSFYEDRECHHIIIPQLNLNPLLLNLAKSGLSQWFLNLLSNQACQPSLLLGSGCWILVSQPRFKPSLLVPNTRIVEYSWDDQKGKTLTTVQHIFQEIGFKNIRLISSRKGSERVGLPELVLVA